MENSYRFYSNRECSYFPCHEVRDKEEFNCMFCYCPLYLMEDCGGNHKNLHGIKDCTACLIPHRPNGYEYINEKIAAYNRKKTKKEV